ncbi:hypothetical protein Gotri_008518 [Gossypium trilobum]|uniref:Nucleotide-diphospho-sugar transferase domain-containing protein n=1 Tax=Gossypium trilobum TaxID=34281 RepID=A0A7J9EKC6_9ROSI|nr:hypothetical protein [Gossypium trilobum]
MRGWRNAVQETAASKPLFLTIYATVILGTVVSSFYVFSAIYSPTASPTRSISSSWLLAPPLSQNGVSLSSNISQPSQHRSNKLRPIWEAPSRTSKMPRLKSFRLTKELVAQRAKDNVIIVTFGNFAFMDFILTWVKHLTDLGVSNLLVGAMDTKLLKALYWKGIPVFDMGSHISTDDVGWGSPIFHKMGRQKVLLINAILPFGFELLMCDTDMVWLKNPLPYLARYPDADILTSSDQVVPTVVDDRLADWKQVGAAYNIGIFHWRPTPPAKKLAKEWIDMLLADDKIWDQNGFNELVRRQTGPAFDDESGIFYSYDGNLKLGILPESLFCSGHTYFVQALHQQFRLQPYALHTTFQYAGTEGKRHRLREAMVFFDPPEYYDAPGGFLSFRPSISKSLLLDGEHNLESHFSLINYQMRQIRSALAIASVLNRTLYEFCHELLVPSSNKSNQGKTIYNLEIHLSKEPMRCVVQVMPPLWCRLDRLWFPHPGALLGSLTRQPFLCPLDHVFEHKSAAESMFRTFLRTQPVILFLSDLGGVNVMLRDLPAEEFGPAINIREYSFLNNPFLPQRVRESWLDVQLCQEGTEDCHASSNTSRPGLLRFPKRSSEETTREEKFRKRVKRYVGIWCCVENHIPGHIYYDMYWDEKPGWKPIPPKTPEDDHPPF